MVVVAILLGLAGLLVLNVLGVLRYPGGPLREPSADGLLWLDIRPADQGSAQVADVSGYWHAIDVPLQYGLLSLSNNSGYSATVEAVTPIDPSPGLIVDALYVLKTGAAPGDVLAWGTGGVYPTETTLDRDYTTLPAVVEPAADALHPPNVILVVRSREPGAIGWSALAVDYRIGPFTFRTVHHLALAGCLGPLPAGTTCGDEPVDHEEEDEDEAGS